MVSSIIGKALIVAWSFTVSNLGPTPQILNLGPPPTASNYVPVEMIIKNITTKDVTGLSIAFGTNDKNPTNVLDDENLYSYDPAVVNPNFNGYMPFGMGGNSIVHAKQNLYVQYSNSTVYPAKDKPITIDVLAYPAN